LNANSAASDINGPECVNRQMESWGTSESKLKELCILLNKWYITNFFLFIGVLLGCTNHCMFLLIQLVSQNRATYIRGKYDNESLSSSIYVTVGNLERKYLSEAEPFLEQYAKSSPANLALVRAAGDMVQTEKFLAILDAQRDKDKEDDFQPECGAAPSSPTASLDVVSKTEGLIVFFPGKFYFLGTDSNFYVS
jgi:hypothetical protein